MMSTFIYLEEAGGIIPCNIRSNSGRKERSLSIMWNAEAAPWIRGEAEVKRTRGQEEK